LVALAIVAFFATRGGGSSGGPSNAIVEAAEVTEHERGGHLTFHSTLTESKRKPTELTGAMVFDRTDASEGVVRTSSPDFGGPVAMRVIADGDSFYEQPNGSVRFHGERKWLGFGYVVGQEADEFDFVGADAAGELKALGEATDVVAAGKGRVRGVETARYSGQAPGLGRVEVWIDGNDRVRRLRVDGSRTKRGTTPATTRMTADFFGFGVVPVIKEPPRREVASVLEFEKGELEREGE
jgi:hypothetical protein